MSHSCYIYEKKHLLIEINEFSMLSFGCTNNSMQAHLRIISRAYAIMTRAKRLAGIAHENSTREKVVSSMKNDPLKSKNSLSVDLAVSKPSKPEKNITETSWSRMLVPISQPADISKRLAKIVREFDQPENPHLLKVALLGAANAGKSTLMNQLLGSMVSVVSPKAHTTREQNIGILTHENKQIVFLDTPGVIYGRNKIRMNRGLVNASWNSLREADHVLVVIDAAKVLLSSSTSSEKYLFERLNDKKVPATLVINKIDQLNNLSLVSSVIERYKPMYQHFICTHEISALEGKGIEELKNSLFERSEPRPWLYPADQKDSISDLKKVEEFIRVEFFQRLHQYIPYMLRQENIGWMELPKNILQIDQNLYVERESQMKIILGKNGELLKSAVAAAKYHISKALGRRVHLNVQVKVRPR